MSFLKWIHGILSKAAEWVVSIPGMVATFIGTVVVTISNAFNFFVGHTSEVQTLTNSAQGQVNSLSSFLSDNSLFATLSYVFSIDIVWSYLYSIISFFIGVFSFLFVNLVTSLLILLAAVMVFKSVRWIASLITLGISKF